MLTMIVLPESSNGLDVQGFLYNGYFSDKKCHANSRPELHPGEEASEGFKGPARPGTALEGPPQVTTTR